MLSVSLILIINSLICSLRVSTGAGSFPKALSAEEERKYLKLYAEGDEEARNILIERNLRLVAHVMKKYYTPSSDQEDLISIGTIGLIKAITTFDVEKGARLATYAARCIENEILMHFRSRRKTAGDVYLSDTIETGKDGNTLSLIDVISVEDDMFDKLSRREMTSKLMECVDKCLTKREKEVVSMRYGLGGMNVNTQREIAQKLDISRSYVSRIEKKALEKLKEQFDKISA